MYKEVKIDSIDTQDSTYLNSFEYWQTKEQLQPWIEIAWWSWAKFKVWSGTFTATWNQSVTWVWFKPKYLQIQATITANNIWDSNWMTDWVTQSVIYQFITGWPTIVNDRNSIYIIYVYNQTAWLVSIGQFVSFDSDWFTINITNLAAWNIKYQYTAFW